MKNKIKVCIIILLASIFLPIYVITAGTNVSESRDVYYVNVKIEYGDTLWSIAQKHKPKQTSVSRYIEEIKNVNGFKNDAIIKNDYLILPVEK